MEIEEEDVPRALRLLDSMIQLSNKQRQEIDRAIGASRGFTSQLLTGRVQLKYGHVMKILRVLGVDPSVFFRILFPDKLDPNSGKDLLLQFLERLYGPEGAQARLQARAEPEPPPPVDFAALGQVVEEAVAKALSAPRPPDRGPQGPTGPRRRK